MTDGHNHGIPSGIAETLQRLADDDAVDPMAFQLAVMLASVTADLAERDEWDEHDRLCTVVRQVDGDVGALGVAEVPSAILHGGPPGERIRMLTEVMRRRPDAVPFDMVGWVLITEAWMLAGPEVSFDEYKAVAAEHRVHEHPDRVEIRILAMVDRAGNNYQTITRRDGADEPVMLVDFATDETTVEGAVPSALHDLMNATPMERTTP